jgi:ATP-dependent Zn protease
VTFVPGSRTGAGPTQVARTLLFWVLMLVLAIILWKMAVPNPNNGTPEEKLNYSDFMQQVDHKNVASADFFALKTTTEIHGKLREPPDRYRVTVSNEVVRSVTEQLRSEGAAIQVVAGSTWIDFLINLAPFVILLAAWIYLLKRRWRKPPQTTTTGEPQNRPIE